MQALQVLFPRNDCTLLALIVLLPLLGAVINGVFGKRLGREAVTLAALTTIGGSFLLSVAAFLLLAEAQTGDQAIKLFWKGWEWVSLNGRGGGAQFQRERVLRVIDFLLSRVFGAAEKH